MRKMLFVALWLNFAFEGLVGVMLLFTPYSGAEEFNVATQMFTVHYGMAAITIASMVFWVWRFGESVETLSVCIGFLALFHTALTASSLMLVGLGSDPVPAVLHGVLALAFLFFFFNRAGCVKSVSP